MRHVVVLLAVSQITHVKLTFLFTIAYLGCVKTNVANSQPKHQADQLQHDSTNMNFCSVDGKLYRMHAQLHEIRGQEAFA